MLKLKLQSDFLPGSSQLSIASSDQIVLEGNLCRGQSVCSLSFTSKTHTHRENSERRFKALKMYLELVLMNIFVCVHSACSHPFVCVYVNVYVCVCVVFVRWGCSPWGGGCTDHFQSREICSPLHEQNVPGCRYDSRASQKKALMCFDSSAVKRSVMPRLSVLFIPNHRADKQNTKADSRLAESSGGAERGCRDNFQQGGSLHSVLPLSQCLQRKTVRCSNVCQLTAGFRCLSEK